MTLEQIVEELKADPRNKAYTDRGVGPIMRINPKARIVIVSQAPGRVVEETGISFNDKSGDKLRDWMGVDRETFYSDKIGILPMDLYFPGKGKSGDKPPRKFIAKEYHEKLLALMPEVELTILVGKYAIDYYLKGRTGKNLTETVRRFRDYLPEALPIVHPSPLTLGWQKKNPWFEKEVLPELKQRVHQILEA
ncbi:MAG: uracil-DNA glycosylase family protein [Pseudoramibacter sp.]